ncbi:archease [Dissulfurirhabdus thermomarina]|uniref:Archease n=1 Tax=Dissulfurirhabdus thermomarina TaxID=1765737 RepID=A0A6N9TQ43_DISTH|nr:archease [Dissulfurirhabdus thermomarina]NDY43391.1 archease [Dissulfurirhabdus thermomarina]NMX23251.1 archease [Dissulfurirhabdus thermomarina]
METFEHGADIGIRGRGPTLEAAFADAARALFSLVVTNLDAVRPVEAVPVRCTGDDLEGLFVAWLNTLLAEADIRGFVFSGFEVSIRGLGLSGTARGEPFDPARHEPGVEVKGATYTELAVRETGPGWIAQCVVDV